MSPLACDTVGFAQERLADLLPRVRDAGYDAVEVSWPRVLREFPGARNPAATLRSLLEEHGLTLSGLRIADAAAESERTVAETLELLREHMRRAYELGLRSVTIAAGSRRSQPLEFLTRQLVEAAATARDLGLTVALLNAGGTRLEQIEDLRWLTFELRDADVRLALDTGACHEAGVNPRDAIAEFADLIAAVRLGDRIGKRAVPLGEGETNVPAILEDLGRHGHTGPLILAPPRADYASLVLAKDTIASLLAKLG